MYNDLIWKTSPNLVNYDDALQFMEEQVAMLSQKISPETIWLLEHPPLYTKGSLSKDEDLLGTYNFPVYSPGRGGKFTYHGPGQRVAYVMLDLRKLFFPESPDIRKFVQMLEEWIIVTLKNFGIIGERRKDRIGIWVITNGQEKKIAALGIRLKKHITYHGIAININPNLDHFNGIIPCGISDYGVTSMAEMGINISLEEFDIELKKNFIKIFEDKEFKYAK